MGEKISKIMLKRTSQIIALIVLIITAIGAIAVSRNKIKNITNLDSETARAMTYGEVQSGDEKTETPYVEFNSYFLRDLNNDGIAEKIKGTCKEVNQTDTLYMDINVLTNGYLENGKIEIQGENFNLQTTIVKDAVVAKNNISENTKKIELNKINNGTQKLLMGKIKANIGKNINNYSSNNNKIILTGTHVAENGTRTEIIKEIVLSTDWYGKIENEIYPSNTSYDIEKVLDKENGKINLEFAISSYETLSQLLLKSNTVEGTIPELNGYKPIEVKITGEDIEYTYDETTGKFKATRNAELNTNTGELTKEAYNTTYYANKGNRYNIKLVYPYEAYETLESDTISLNIPISSVYEGYNNPNTEFENPIKSNVATYTYTFIWKEEGARYTVDIGTYRALDYQYVVSKKEPLKIYNGETNSEIEDKYQTRWYFNAKESQKIQLKEPTTNYGDKFLTTENKYINMTPYTKYIGIYFYGATNLIKKDGYINLYNDETNELIHTFTKEELEKYTRTNPYMYEQGVKHIRLETSEVNDESTTVCNIKQIDDEALTNAYTKTEFDKLQYIYTYLQVNTMQTNGTWSQSGSDTSRAEYEEPVSKTSLSISRTKFSTQETEKKLGIKIDTEANYFNIEKWQDGVFLVKLPTEILDVEINSVKISNNNVKVLGYEVLEKDGSKFIKILTQNDTPLTYTITIDTNITADPRIATTTKSIELYAYNKEANNYLEKAVDKYDVNDNGNTSENVNYISEKIDLISPTSLLTNEKMSNYDNKNSFIISPQVAEIDIDETRNATVEVSITNNYSRTISDILIVGKIPFKGNKYQLQNTADLGSTITTNITGPIALPTELQGIATVYYSENETITKDTTDSGNNFKKESQVTDWSKIKTYVIDLGEHKLAVNKEYKFTYKIKLPTVLNYNEVTYSTHAVYFALDTENGKLYTQTEAGKVGIRIARKFDINITKTKLGKDIAVQGATFNIVEEGQEIGKVAVTNYEGKVVVQNLYADKMYILKEILPARGYSSSNTEVKFRTYVENNELKYEIVSGKVKTDSVTQAEGNTKAHIDFGFENVPKYKLVLNKKDTEGNNLKSIKFNIKGNNSDKNIYTSKDGIATIQDLEAGVEYTLTEVRATGYYILQEPIKFKLNNDNGTLSFTVISGSFNSNAQITESTEVSGKQAEDQVEVNLVNEKIPTYNLELTKYEKDQEKTLEGAQFKIEGDGLKEGGEYITTDEKGVLTIEGLYQYVEGKYITGEYTITELTPPEGYKLTEEPIKVRYNNGTLEIISGTIKGEATVENGIAKIEIENEPLFVLTKINETTKEPIQGVKFAIYEIDESRNIVDFAKDINGNYVGEEETINGKTYKVLTTNKKGIITVGLKEGLYKAVEVEAPKSFEFNENVEARTSYFGIGKNISAVKGIKSLWENNEKSYYYRDVTIANKDIVAVGDNGKVVKYDLEGNVVWENTDKSYNYRGVTTVSDGIITVSGGNTAGNIYGQVVKYDLEGNVVWENSEKTYKYYKVVTVDNGIIAIASGGQVVKYNLEGNVVWENTEKSYLYYGVTAVDDGILAVGYSGKVVKYDSNGNIEWENTEKSYSYIAAVTLEDGIIAISENGLAVEYDFDGKCLFDKSIGITNLSDAVVTEDGIVVVEYGGFDWNGNIAKIDFAGNQIWETSGEKTGQSIINRYTAVTAINDAIIAVTDKGQVVKIGEAETAPEIAQSQEITVQNIGKALKIKTEVEQYQKNGVIITGGTITGQDEEYVEQVEYKKDSTKEIKAVPDTGYRVEKITVNGEQIEFTPNEDESVTLSKFIQVIEDKNIVVKFSDTIGQVKVNHYIKGTTTKVIDDVIDTRSKTLTGEIGDTYTTEPLIGLKEYELEKDSNGEYVIPENASGTYTSEAQEVNYYYELKDLTLTVHHYLVNTETKLAEDEQKTGKIHSEYTTEKSSTIDYTKYELVEEPENKEGTLEQDTEVIYYYRLKEGKVIVHHYIQGTTTQVPSKDGSTVVDETIIGKVDETYTTKASKDIATNYEYVSKTTNSTGAITAETIEVTYYYKMKEGTIEENNITKEGTTLVQNVEEVITYNISYTTKITNYKGRVQVIVTDKLPQAIDETKSNIAGGEYDSTNKTITWKQYIPDVDTLNGEAKVITINEQISLVYDSVELRTKITNKVGGSIKLLDTNQEETNTDEQETIINGYETITITKVWSDNNNANGKRPESIKLQVKNGQTVVKEQVVTEAENWKYTFTDLPKYNSQGNKIVYTVDEAEVNTDDLKFYTKAITGATITNTFTVPDKKGKITVNKVWDDNENANGKRPEGIKLQIKNGQTVVKEQVVTEAEEWKYIFTDLPIYDGQGNRIAYTVDEAEVNANDLKFYTKTISGATITNTFTVPDKKGSITVSKVWNDNDNANGKRPESIKLQVKNGSQVVAEQVVTETEGWKYTFMDLPIYNAQGNAIVYTVDEAEVNTDDLKFYTKAISGATITNTFTVPDKKGSITVNKVWDDNNNANGKRPESIRLQVKNGSQVVAEQVVTETEGWKYTFMDLPIYNAQGNAIVYTVDEAEVNTDDLKFYTKAISGATITNTFTVPDKKGRITVNKVWDDNENANGKRPESIKLQIKDGQTVVKEQVVTEAEEWKYIFTDLPIYDGQGNRIAYTVDEAEVNTDDLKFYTKAISGATITNTFVVPEEKTELTVEKVWDDNENANGKRPESIKLQVKNGQTVVKEQVVTEAENWKYTFTDLQKYNAQGNEIVYTVDEAEVNADDLMFYTKAMNGTTITNTFSVPDNKISITVNKMWNDENNMYGKRPESIKLQIKEGNRVVQEATVTENDEWRYTFTDLAKYDEQGNEISYIVDEQEINTDDLKFYTKTIEGTTITNTFKVPDEKVNVTVNKVWNDNNNANGKRPEKTKLLVKNGNQVVAEQVVTEAENWKYTFTDLPKYNAQGNEIAYTVDESEVNENDLKFYTKTIEGTTITNTFTVPDEKVNVTVNKVWNDSNDVKGYRPESIKLLVKNGSQVVAEQVVTEAENWKYTFTDLPKYNAQGNEITYTVDEAEVNASDLKFYTKTIEGTTITNTFAILEEKTEVTVEKVWNDNENANGKRPESIKLQVKNGQTVVKEQVVTEAESWKYTFTDLPKYNAQGSEIVYTVDESEVNKNDLKFYTKTIEGTTITNTFTVPNDKIKLKVSKVWDDSYNAKGYRPESIKLLVKNGSQVVAEQVITEAENWKYTFTDLPKYNAQGNEIVYTVEEAEVNSNDLARYKGEISKVIENEVIVVNTYNYGNILIRYVDRDTGEELGRDEIEGKIGDGYVTDAKEIKGYKNISKTENSKGVINEGTTEVIYYYEKIKEEPKPVNPILPTTGDTFISEIIILITSATAYLVVLALKHKRCK